ncbi:hypothetical protein ACFL21_01630 [Patescibacteria group bacterium]
MTLNQPGSYEEPEGQEEGLGLETNRQIFEAISQGNYAPIIDIIASTIDKDKACSVLLSGMLQFKHVDRATDIKEFTKTALTLNPEVMASLIRYSYHHNPTSERFWQNPYDPSQTLFTDKNGAIISFTSNIATVPKGLPNEEVRYIKSLHSYTVLSGPDKGNVFQNSGNHRIPHPEPN